MIVRRNPLPAEAAKCFIKVWPDSVAIVDPEDFEWLSKFRWKLVKSNSCYYAVRKFWRNGRYHYRRMHREIMNTPEGQEVHHKEGNPLDNRKSMMQNLTPKEHKNYATH